MNEIVTKLNEFLEGGSVSMSALARALGISPGAISQFRAGKYKGDNAAIAAKIGAYIDASAKKAKELDQKIEWLEEIGYELINEIISAEDMEHNHDEEDCQDESCDQKDAEVIFPESWPLSIFVKNIDGSCSPPTYAILKLIELTHPSFVQNSKIFVELY